MLKAVVASLLLCGALMSPAAALQTAAPTAPPAAARKPVAVERIKVHSKALEGNLQGESPDRDVVVYLPPD